jgi:bacterioferritin-associated ferredoxin
LILRVVLSIISAAGGLVLVCHCLRVFDRTIRECVRGGARTADDVSDQCGAGTGCGGCRESIVAIVEHESRASEAVLVVALRSDDLAA